MTEHVAGEAPWYADVVIPALIRGARRTYASAIRAALVEVGCDDMPRNGSFVVGSIARNGSPLGDVIKELGISKQRAGQLVDTLVSRGYLERVTDAADRRRMTVSLTERGSAAASAGRAAVERVDADLTARVGAAAVSETRRTLGALIAAGVADEEDD
jgi:DNA-binding MarR family transcriptional regulator